MTRAIALFCILLSAIGCASEGDTVVADESQLAAEFVQLPAFGVELRLPITFEPKLSEDQFHAPGGGAYVGLSAKPRHYEVDPKMGEEMFDKPRMRLIDEEERQLNGETAMLFYFEDKLLGDTTYVNWLLVVGIGDQTISVTGAYEKDQKAKYAPAIKASVLSLRAMEGSARKEFASEPKSEKDVVELAD